MYFLKEYSFARKLPTDKVSLNEEIQALIAQDSRLFSDGLLFQKGEFWHQSLRNDIPRLEDISRSSHVSRRQDAPAQFHLRKASYLHDNLMELRDNIDGYERMLELGGTLGFYFAADLQEPSTGYLKIACSSSSNGEAKLSIKTSAIRNPAQIPHLSAALVEALNATDLIEKFDCDWKDFGWGVRNVIVFQPKKPEFNIKVRNFTQSRKSQTISFGKQGIRKVLERIEGLLSFIELPNAMSKYGIWSSGETYCEIRDGWRKNLGSCCCNFGYLGSYKTEFDPLQRPDIEKNVLRYPLHTVYDKDGNCMTTVIAVHFAKSSCIEIGTESGRNYLHRIVDQFGKDKFEFLPEDE